MVKRKVNNKISYQIKNFQDLAWGAFMIRGMGEDKAYYEIIENELFSNLKNDFKINNLDVFRDVLMKFLNSWKCRASTKKIGNKLLKLIEENKNLFKKLCNKKLYSLSEEEINLANQIYNNFINSNGIGIAITTKTLHILNTEVFVPTDNKIFKTILEIKETKENSPDAYSTFLSFCKEQIIRVETSKMVLNDKITKLMKRLYPGKNAKTIAKLIDEFFWISITNGFKLPPDWDPSKKL